MRARSTSRNSSLRYQLANIGAVRPDDIRNLFRAAGWTDDITRYSARQIRKLLRCSHTVLTAWHGRELVGLASAVSDGVLCGVVQNLIVHPRYRRRGLGSRLLRRLARQLTGQRIASVFVLGNRGSKARAFFHRAGFRPLDWNVYVRLHR